MHALFAAFMTEARTRAAGTIPELDAYLRVREQTVGLHVEFALGEIVQAIDLSPAQRESPGRVALAALASDLETHNLVFVLAQAGALARPAAVARAVAMHDAAMLRAWVRGHLDWGRETGRYAPEMPVFMDTSTSPTRACPAVSARLTPR